MATRAFLIYCVATAAGFLTGVYFMTAGMFDRYSCQDNGKEFGIIRQYSDQYVSHAECEMPFVLNIIVELKPEVRQEWLDQWAQLAQYVFDNEPTLISYELLEVENKSNTFMVYERYCRKSDLKNIHQQSQPFNNFKAWCAENEPYVIKDGEGAYPIGAGHWLRE